MSSQKRILCRQPVLHEVFLHDFSTVVWPCLLSVCVLYMCSSYIFQTLPVKVQTASTLRCDSYYLRKYFVCRFCTVRILFQCPEWQLQMLRKSVSLLFTTDTCDPETTIQPSTTRLGDYYMLLNNRMITSVSTVL